MTNLSDSEARIVRSGGPELALDTFSKNTKKRPKKKTGGRRERAAARRNIIKGAQRANLPGGVYSNNKLAANYLAGRVVSHREHDGPRRRRSKAGQPVRAPLRV